MLDQINLSGGAQLFLLPPVHSGTRAAVSVIFPQLDLHKVKGDSLSASIAAASILAKVSRDRFMAPC